MPRKSSKAKKADTSLISHRTPALAQLLEKAKTCRLEPLKQFLAAGGHPDTIVEIRYGDDCVVTTHLLFKAILQHHEAGCEGSLAALLDAGAKTDFICTGLSGGGMDSTALMVAC
jgi:hypothetical protein